MWTPFADEATTRGQRNRSISEWIDLEQRESSDESDDDNQEITEETKAEEKEEEEKEENAKNKVFDSEAEYPDLYLGCGTIKQQSMTINNNTNKIYYEFHVLDDTAAGLGPTATGQQDISLIYGVKGYISIGANFCTSRSGGYLGYERTKEGAIITWTRDTPSIGATVEELYHTNEPQDITFTPNYNLLPALHPLYPPFYYVEPKELSGVLATLCSMIIPDIWKIITEYVYPLRFGLYLRINDIGKGYAKGRIDYLRKNSSFNTISGYYGDIQSLHNLLFLGVDYTGKTLTRKQEKEELDRFIIKRKEAEAGGIVYGPGLPNSGIPYVRTMEEFDINYVFDKNPSEYGGGIASNLSKGDYTRIHRELLVFNRKIHSMVILNNIETDGEIGSEVAINDYDPRIKEKLHKIDISKCTICERPLEKLLAIEICRGKSCTHVVCILCKFGKRRDKDGCIACYDMTQKKRKKPNIKKVIPPIITLKPVRPELQICLNCDLKITAFPLFFNNCKADHAYCYRCREIRLKYCSLCRAVRMRQNREGGLRCFKCNIWIARDDSWKRFPDCKQKQDHLYCLRCYDDDSDNCRIRFESCVDCYPLLKNI